jgi:tetratricopeptide (TPR) repeat protein
MVCVVWLFFCLFAPSFALAADGSEAHFQKALKALADNGYSENNLPAQFYLRAVLYQEPEHLEAQWLLMYLKLVGLEDMPVSARAARLSEVAPAFARLAKQTREQKKQAFLHFITARYAGYYGAYDRAISEISKAVAAEPNSARYLLNKGLIFVAYGKRIRRDREIEQGIAVIRNAQKLASIQPDPYNEPGIYDFQLAYAMASLAHPRWNEVVQHYTRFIEQAEKKNTSYAFAWSNLSIAHRHLGQCAKAKEAAENALRIMAFGAARLHLRGAEFCIEMQKLGIMNTEQSQALEGSRDATYKSRPR